MNSIQSLIDSVPDPAQSADCHSHALEIRSFNRELRALAFESLNRQDFHGMIGEHMARFGLNPKLSSVEEVCVGSDGREEKGVCSPIEMAVYITNIQKKILSDEQATELQDRVNRDFRSLEGAEFFSRIELKTGGRPVSQLGSDFKSCWPDRVLDSLPLGEREFGVSIAARVWLQSEIRREHGNGMLRELGSRVRAYKAICQDGIQKIKGSILRHFDLNEGVAFFSDRRHDTGLVQGSFKQNLLRLVQNTVVREIVRAVKEGDRTDSWSFVMSLPTNVADRLNTLEEHGVINPDKLNRNGVQQLADNYLYFLNQYHRSEFECVRHGKEIIEFDSKEVRERIADTIDAAERLVNTKVAFKKPRIYTQSEIDELVRTSIKQSSVAASGPTGTENALSDPDVSNTEPPASESDIAYSRELFVDLMKAINAVPLTERIGYPRDDAAMMTTGAWYLVAQGMEVARRTSPLSPYWLYEIGEAWKAVPEAVRLNPDLIEDAIRTAMKAADGAVKLRELKKD